MKILRGVDGRITALTPAHVAQETGPPGLHAEHSQYVNEAGALKLAYTSSEVMPGLLPPVVKPFCD